MSVFQSYDSPRAVSDIAMADSLPNDFRTADQKRGVKSQSFFTRFKPVFLGFGVLGVSGFFLVSSCSPSTAKADKPARSGFRFPFIASGGSRSNAPDVPADSSCSPPDVPSESEPVEYTSLCVGDLLTAFTGSDGYVYRVGDSYGDKVVSSISSQRVCFSDGTCSRLLRSVPAPSRSGGGSVSALGGLLSFGQ